jgi:hypothetical protein
MTITKVLVALYHEVRQLRHRGGPGDRQIARCVGDVDKSTFSENLGAGVEPPGIEDRKNSAARPGQEWWAEAFEGPMGGPQPSNRLSEFD